MEAQLTLLDRGDRRAGELLHVAEPLERDQRLDPHAGAVRVRHVVDVGLSPGQQALVAQRLDDRALRFVGC
jgi:hypothetical protein